MWSLSNRVALSRGPHSWYLDMRFFGLFFNFKFRNNFVFVLVRIEWLLFGAINLRWQSWCRGGLFSRFIIWKYVRILLEFRMGIDLGRIEKSSRLRSSVLPDASLAQSARYTRPSTDDETPLNLNDPFHVTLGFTQHFTYKRVYVAWLINRHPKNHAVENNLFLDAVDLLRVEKSSDSTCY